MSAYFALIVAILSRLLPSAFHTTSVGFTAVGGGLLFFGARRSRWQSLLAVAALAGTDYYLTTFVYSYPFHVSAYLVTWIWYAAVCLFGHQLLAGRPSALRVAAGVLATSTSFFLISNFMVWAGGNMYPHNLSGLIACYAAAIPFYRNDVLSTAVVAGLAFGIPVMVRKISLANAVERVEAR